MNVSSNKKHTMVGMFIFIILAIIGLYGTITSFIHVYLSYAHQSMEWAVIHGVLGVFMLIWFLYFSKELYQLIVNRYKHI